MTPLTATAIALTDAVEAAIDAGDWVRAAELEAERRGVLEQLAAGGAVEDVTNAFTALAERNHRLIGLVRHHQRRVLREAAVARSASNAAALYAAAGASAVDPTPGT